MAKHNKIGEIGEGLATKWLISKGFRILDTNYRQKWGEIDIIAEKEGIVHFVEVKSVSYETREKLDHAVSHGTWRPEERVHEQKLKRMGRTIETWLLEKNREGDCQVDVLTVRLVPREKYAKINLIDNIVFE